MYIKVNLDPGQLAEDGKLYCKMGENGFPYLYVGRGTYATDLQLYSLLSGDVSDDVHFFQVGRYTSIGDGNQILFNMNHDFNAVFQGVITDFGDKTVKDSFRLKLGQSERTLKQKGMVIIGNDVWIGNNVIILPGVVIGNGAVIGAGSIVTKDVPPYAICAGNPASSIRYRFPEHIINGLQKIAWWNFSKEELLAAKEDMMGDVEKFVEKYAPSAQMCEKRGEYLPTLGSRSVPILLLFLDVVDAFPAFARVIEEFVREYSDKSSELVLVYHDNDAEKQVVNIITQALGQMSADVLLSAVMVDEADEESIISDADCLFMTRDVRNIVRTSYAFKYGVKCLSAIDKPIFSEKTKKDIREAFDSKRQ